VEARSVEVLGKSKKLKEINFGKLSIDHKTRCINDVQDMVDMEKKLGYIPLLDGIRRLAKTKWEDYIFNSRYIDQLLLSEAKKQRIVLPMKPVKEDEGKDFEGAFREAFHKGRHFNKGAYDLAGAYLNAIIELCLDPANVLEEQTENSVPVEVTDRITNKVIAVYHVKQNPEAILPLVAKKLLVEKNKFKRLKNETDPNAPEYKLIEEQYKSWKSLSLSAWGVIGNKYFRYYDYRTTSLITSVIRGLLHYVADELPKKGYTLEYIDTDGAIIDDKGEDISNWLNELIQKWFQKKFNKPTKILFDYEGNYEKLFVVALTRYRGWLRRPDGTLEEKNVGLEIKRKDSTDFLRQVQEELLELILNKCTKEEAIELIKTKLIEIKEQPLKAISFPVKLSKKPSEYATEIKRGNKIIKRKPYITVRALENANLKKKVGELFYWIYCDKQIPVAFEDENTISNVDWAKMKERNIYNKAQAIFEAMGWWKKERGKKFLGLFEAIEPKKKRKKKEKKDV
jgi:DNA polymerase elongation subunit (family B)